MTKWFVLLIVLLSSVFCNAATEKSYAADHYIVDLHLLDKGSIHVEETVVFHFTGGPFHYVKRDVPDSKVDALIFEKALMDSVLITQSSVPNFYQISRRRGLHIKWNYTPLKDETHSYTFSYLVVGAYLLENGMVHLLWKPLPTDFSYPMQKATVNIHLPKEIPASRISYGPETSLIPQVVSDSLLVYEYHYLAPGTEVRVDLKFPENLIPVRQPDWISHKHVAVRQIIIVLVSFFILFFVIIIFAVVIGINRSNRMKHYHEGRLIINEFPSVLEPALVCRLLNGSFSITTAVYATLVNLAQKGVLTMQSIPKQKWYETYGGLNFSYKENQVELTPTEQMITDFVFGNQPTVNSVSLLELQKILSKNTRYMQRYIDDSLIRDGLIDSFQLDKRKRIMTFGIIMMLVSFAVIFGIISIQGDLALKIIIPFVAVFLLSNLLLISAALRVIFTESGLSEIACWKSYAKYLKKRMKEPFGDGNAEEFSRIFPYSLVMNLGREWVNYFKKNGVDVGAVWLEFDGSIKDTYTPFIIISNISSPSSGGSSSGGGGSGGGGGGGSSAG